MGSSWLCQFLWVVVKDTDYQRVAGFAKLLVEMRALGVRLGMDLALCRMDGSVFASHDECAVDIDCLFNTVMLDTVFPVVAHHIKPKTVIVEIDDTEKARAESQKL